MKTDFKVDYVTYTYTEKNAKQKHCLHSILHKNCDEKSFTEVHENTWSCTKSLLQIEALINVV